MKKRLDQFEEVKILRRNEKLISECCYILSSESVASNLYFETKRDIIRAHKLINTHLSSILDIVDYLFTPHGWILVVGIKSEVEILEQLDRKRYRSRTMKRALKKRDVSTIISECIRYVVSGMARIVNGHNRRKGTLVRRNFSRYIFESLGCAKEVMKKMKEEQIKLCCQRRRYVPSLKWYDKVGDLRKNGDVFLSSRDRGRAGLSGVTVGKCVTISNNNWHVLHKLINRTFITHFPQKNTTPTPTSPLII